MESNYEVETLFMIYKVLGWDSFKPLEHVKSFGNKTDAEKWIKENGSRKQYYTIIEMYRKQ